MTMLTHHGAEDDSSRIVGRVTGVHLAEDGAARFTADLADTSHSRDIASLISVDGGEPFLSGVSIRGAWAGKVRRETTEDGRLVETGDDLEIDGLDWTKNPGVPGAVIDGVERAGPQETDSGRALIYESVREAHVESIEDTPVEEKGAAPLKSGKPAAAPTKAPAGSYADPGYQGDKAPRYPLDTKAHAKSAWAYVNQAKNSKNYTAKQLKRIKGRIKAALRKFGVEVSADEGWLVDHARAVSEDYGGEYPSQAGSLVVTLDNGMVCVTVSSYCVDPHDLDLIGRAAMDGACAALSRIDPDMDGDMDVPGAGSEDTDRDMGEQSRPDDDQMETAPSPAEQVRESEPDDQPPADAGGEQPAPDPDAEPTQEEEHAVSEPTTPAAEPEPAAAPETPAATGGVTLSMEQFELLLSKLRAPEPVAAGAPAESAATPAEPVKEAEGVTAQAVTETEEQRITRLVAEGVKAALPLAVQQHVESAGPPARKGLVGRLRETAGATQLSAEDYPDNWPVDSAGAPLPAHKIPRDQWTDVASPQLEQYVLGRRADR